MQSLSGLISAVYCVLEKFTPKTDSYCFISYPDVSDNAYAVYSHAVEAARGSTFTWLVKDVGAAKAVLSARRGNRYAKTKVVKKNSLSGLFAFLRAKKVFFTHGHYWFVRSMSPTKKLINLWHGMPLKAIGRLDARSAPFVHAADATIASSDFFRPHMSKAFGLPESAVVVTGLPRCDVLFEEGAKALRFKSRMLGHEYGKMIVWMPTYRLSIVGEERNDGGGVASSYIDDFRAACRKLARAAKRERVLVVVKLHPMDFLNSEALGEFEGVIVLRANDPLFEDIQPYELLSVSDGLITDVSSVCFDYMVTGKPILVTEDAIRAYRRDLLFDVGLLLQEVCSSSSLGDLEEFLERVMAPHEKRSCSSNPFVSIRAPESARLAWETFC